ncbi:hypothetical protein U9M48_018490 [Paspalum notatum var. saurae]|uniref:Uncharacterized protein n=1 Tax=Paspalum notatum var. saurae TaxID=547442 RepID=A0AAQ3TBW0_PASNO
MYRARSLRSNFHQSVGAIDALNEWRLPKISEGEDKVIKRTGRPMPSRLVYPQLVVGIIECDAFEGSNHSDRACGDSVGENCTIPVPRVERRLPLCLKTPRKFCRWQVGCLEGCACKLEAKITFGDIETFVLCCNGNAIDATVDCIASCVFHLEDRHPFTDSLQFIVISLVS